MGIISSTTERASHDSAQLWDYDVVVVVGVYHTYQVGYL